MTYRKIFSAAALILTFSVLLPQPAAAQQARSFEQLQLLVKPGDRIFVTDATGNVTVGRVAGLSKSALSLTSKTSTRDWSESEVFDIRQWRRDSLKNGALIGTGVGLGLGIIGASFYCAEFRCGRGEGVGIAAFYAGIGAGAGVGIDALIPAKQTVYIGGTRPTASRLNLKPIVSKSRTGVAMAFSF
jgi:hypothetical protein